MTLIKGSARHDLLISTLDGFFTKTLRKKLKEKGNFSPPLRKTHLTTRRISGAFFLSKRPDPNDKYYAELTHSA